MSRIGLVLLLALEGTALAVQPPELAASGREPVRVHHFDAATQRVWAAQPAWRRFAQGEGAGWDARWDELTRTPQRMWGPGLDLGTLDSKAAVARAVDAFVARHATLLGVDGAEPVVATVARHPSADAWYVDVDVLYDGLPVYEGGLTFRFKAGRLVMVGAATWPDAPVEGRLALSARDAHTAFQRQGPHAGAKHVPEGAEPVLLPDPRGGRPVLRAVWLVHTRTQAPYATWSGMVDATTGQVLHWWNTLRHLDGRLDAEVDDRLFEGFVTVPLATATVATDTEDVVTDATGAWSAEGIDPVVVLDGPRVVVRDEAGETTPVIPEGEVLLTAADFGDRQAPLTTFVYVQDIQDFARTIAPEVSWVDATVRANVNVDQTCNAFYDGTINFFREGDGCANTGRLADVIFHEWGHGFHDASLLAGSYDFSLGEGAADTLTFLRTGDSRIAPNFVPSAGRALRDADNDNRYPDDFVDDQNYIHQNGLIFGGSMWDTRALLQERHGDDEGNRITARIFADLLKGGPSLVTSYDEAVFADDDDGDLSNGTPHQCELVEGFGAHGLGPLGGIGLAPGFDEPTGLEPGVPLRWGVPDPAPGCFDLTPRAGTLRWRELGTDAWDTVPLDVDGDGVSAALDLTGLPQGTIVEYVTEIETSEGAVLADPSQGEIRPTTGMVGPVLEILCEDFEQTDGGFGGRLVDGEDTEGANDWERGAPQGNAGDPAAAYSGRLAWGNDFGGGRFDGAYQDDKHNRLVGPRLETHHYEGVTLAYQRWLTVEDGVYDQAIIRVDGEEVWRNWATDLEDGSAHHLDDRWTRHLVPLGEAADDGMVRITFDIVSDRGLHFGGWNIDDFCLIAPDTPDNRLGVSDFTATRNPVGDIALAWTMPRHDPVREVRVVRQKGDWPAGPDDGEVAFRTTDVTVAEAATFVDPDPGTNVYYAVYGSDGETWLSWTREGFNAAAVDPSEGSASGCGCRTTTPVGGAPWLLLGLVGLARRRRR